MEAEACTRARLLKASCHACVHACPEAAIDLSARLPMVDSAACTSCGACVAACPEAVFALPASGPPSGPPSSAQPPPDEAWFVPGPDHVLAARPYALACIQSIGLAELATLWLADRRHLMLATTGPDDGAQPVAGFEQTLAAFNRLAESRNLAMLSLTFAAPAAMAKWLAAAKPPAPEDASRRAFLRRFVAPETPPAPATIAPGEALQVFLALGEAGSEEARLYAFSPHIDAANCTACGDCVNICPHDALMLIKAENGEMLYESAPDLCTGCLLCSDICEENASEVRLMTAKSQNVQLCEYQCRACGAPSHTTARPPADGLCRICRQTGHHKKLFVVLD